MKTDYPLRPAGAIAAVAEFGLGGRPSGVGQRVSALEGASCHSGTRPVQRGDSSNSTDRQHLTAEAYLRISGVGVLPGRLGAGAEAASEPAAFAVGRRRLSSLLDAAAVAGADRMSWKRRETCACVMFAWEEREGSRREAA